MRRRGFTLIEILIASFIGLMVVGGVLALYTTTARDVDRAEASYGLEEKLVTLLKDLQTDLRYTTIASVAVYPTADDKGVGISFLSAGDLGKVDISRFGTPNWQNHVFYTLLENPQSPGTSHLVRYEQPVSGSSWDVVSTHLPYDYSEGDGGGRVVAQELLSPGYDVQAGAGGLIDVTPAANSNGGFVVTFMQKDGSGTTVNPTAGDPTKATGVIIVNLTLLERSELGKLSALPFVFRVAPRN